MKKQIIYTYTLMLILLGFISINSYADTASTSTTPATGPSPFTPSTFQSNGAAITQLESDMQSDLLNKEVEDISFGLHIVNYDGTQLQNPQQQFIADYSRIYCNPAYESAIPECNANNQANSPTTYGNLRPSNIFDVLQYKNTDPGYNAAIAMARNLIEPFPSNQLNTILSDPSAVKNSTQQTTMANLIAPQAALMLAKNSLNDIIAKRTTYSDNPTISVMQMIHDESKRRLTDATWMNGIKQLPTEQLLMELLQVEAFKLWLEYYKFTQNERIEALLATLLASQVTNSAQISQQLNGPDMQKSKDDAQKAIANLPPMPAGAPTTPPSQ